MKTRATKALSFPRFLDDAHAPARSLFPVLSLLPCNLCRNLSSAPISASLRAQPKWYVPPCWQVGVKSRAFNRAPSSSCWFPGLRLLFLLY
ncbi:hypothetical protein KCP75_15890 [Salmonella enterica subsp. enterica]|nr:hypothetical protein KCP75_15890 [Salmonella enterica subsp. enterica]